MDKNWKDVPLIFCPACDSEDIEFINTNFFNDGEYVEFMKICADCNHTWIELFRFVETQSTALTDN